MENENVDIPSKIHKLREKSVNLLDKKVLIANLINSEQERDLTAPPNCGGFGRIKHFRRKNNPNWPDDPLPIDPVCQALLLEPVDMMRAQVFQIASCNYRCWYCFVPYNLLEASQERAKFLSASELIDFYLDQSDPPKVIDLSGGNPELVPEWIVWMMDELKRRGLEKKVYLWSDDNLSTDLFWKVLSDSDYEKISSYPNYSRVCCFKGFDEYSFSCNTGVDGVLFNNQYELIKRLINFGIDIYAYATFTTYSSLSIKDNMKKFVDKLQSISEKLPLRTIPLEIIPFTPVVRRNKNYEDAICNQYIAIEYWIKEIEKRFSFSERRMNIATINNIGKR